ncbi:hypothetical protein NT2_13_00390 [Caenibius tardaugens NBRC 16725]|uniref:EF-hand domain-containing protein n=1 Tax=Caenibius tardaugens NBRC 16725 TaxID=1219035 RepID=U2YQI9_9SPHN|nr:EF-hand domain-containing protein [Caenibius tardaugens]AZI37915.1 hypothetical protein EGO55_19720 [Caenibius tardaugens NBRC 16725]GAD50952.1 hypothetical protein NT2_13_00390 [Caenibius tardaugens NBRC 16725]
MNRIVLGACLALACVGVGLFWWQGRAEVENTAPPPPKVQEAPRSETLPSADVAGLRGPAPPRATELTREQQRFFRYDRNRDWRITRNEMLSTRADAFRKLDSDGNNLLTFEEWAVATSTRFRAADANQNGELSAEEFAATAPKAKAKPACTC